MDTSSIVVRTLRGAEVLAHLDGLAALRMEVFREFPYLYAGELSYERAYLQTYAESPGSVIIGAFDGGGALVGASTAVPLQAEAAYVRAPFEAAGLPVEAYLYYGESVLRRDLRGQGLGVRFFEAREAEARRQGLTRATFCAVVRPADHPRRPAGYVALDDFWRRRGYAPSGLTATFSWRDLDEDAERPKRMTFWERELG